MRNAKDDLALCDKATPGPWMVEEWAELTVIKRMVVCDPKYCGCEGTLEKCGVVGVVTKDEASELDADFIATAREALPYWIERAERLERALEHACVLITNHVNAYGTGMDLPMDLLANSRKPEAWKKYFMQEADQ